jgi:hypothetical protein
MEDLFTHTIHKATTVHPVSLQIGTQGYTLKISLLRCDVMLLLNRCQQFGRIFCLHLQKTEAGYFSEMVLI